MSLHYTASLYRLSVSLTRRRSNFRKFLTLGDTDAVDWSTLHRRIVYYLTKEEAKPDDGDTLIGYALLRHFALDALVAPRHFGA